MSRPLVKIFQEKEKQMAINKNDFFRQATMRICGHLGIETAMASCLRYLETHMPSDKMFLDHFDEDLAVVRTIAEASPSEGKKMNLITPITMEYFEDYKAEFDMPGISIINNPESNPVCVRMLRNYGVSIECSVLSMELEIEEKIMGYLIIAAYGYDRYTLKHAELLSLLKEPFAVAMSNAIEHNKVVALKNMLADDNRYLQRELLRLSGDHIIGEDFGLKNVMEMVRQVASLNSPVLLLGETGVGKDVIANAIHYLSTRKDQPFITVNCGAIPETLVDSELFGHEKGAFTGALTQKRGRFERADKGTIFLDEIGELTPQAQVRLLRVLQNREIERIGGTRPIPVDIRIIAATHRNLENMLKTKQFREDLWFRLNVFPITIPPLRSRESDIPALADHFIKNKSRELNLRTPPKLADGAFDTLMSYHWPGNVRELENVIERALILQKDGPLAFEGLTATPKEERPLDHIDSKSQFQKLDDIVSKHIQQALSITKGKVNGAGGAAELLGMHPNTLRHRMNKLGIAFGKKR